MGCTPADIRQSSDSHNPEGCIAGLVSAAEPEHSAVGCPDTAAVPGIAHCTTFAAASGMCSGSHPVLAAPAHRLRIGRKLAVPDTELVPDTGTGPDLGVHHSPLAVHTADRPDWDSHQLVGAGTDCPDDTTLSRMWISTIRSLSAPGDCGVSPETRTFLPAGLRSRTHQASSERRDVDTQAYGISCCCPRLFVIIVRLQLPKAGLRSRARGSKVARSLALARRGWSCRGG